eukprot:TRINITY_DN650_c0_g2_i1.p1 TRINITY_DN650_c0_g2~~TRINITY_DN650_c0_g2_i1.p1  ORF type:complete len:255 (-),score=37.95 TRINITY_DN650_c0_g2_i1:45-809(-)
MFSALAASLSSRRFAMTEDVEVEEGESDDWDDDAPVPVPTMAASAGPQDRSRFAGRGLGKGGAMRHRAVLREADEAEEGAARSWKRSTSASLESLAPVELEQQQQPEDLFGLFDPSVPRPVAVAAAVTTAKRVGPAARVVIAAMTNGECWSPSAIEGVLGLEAGSLLAMLLAEGMSSWATTIHEAVAALFATALGIVYVEASAGTEFRDQLKPARAWLQAAERRCGVGAYQLDLGSSWLSAARAYLEKLHLIDP